MGLISNAMDSKLPTNYVQQIQGGGDGGNDFTDFSSAEGGGGDGLGVSTSGQFKTAPVATYDPALNSVNKEATVSGQLERLLGEDNPLVTRRRAAALGEKNSRGLINSSMAIGASDAAAIDAALPIASQDASTYANVNALNQGATNRASEFNAGSRNTATLQSTNAENTGLLQQQAGALDIQRQQLLGQQAMLLEKERQGGQLTLQEQAAKQAIERQLLAASQAQTLQQQQTESQSRLQSEGAAQDIARQQLVGAQAKDIETLRAENQVALQELRGTQAAAVNAIDNEYKNLLQTNTLAAGMYSNMLQAMTTIANSSTMDTASKQAAVDNMTLWLDAGLGIIGGVSGYDLRSLLTFEG